MPFHPESIYPLVCDSLTTWSVLIYHNLSSCQHRKYLLLADLFTVALPVLPQSGAEGHVLDPRGHFLSPRRQQMAFRCAWAWRQEDTGRATKSPRTQQQLAEVQPRATAKGSRRLELYAPDHDSQGHRAAVQSLITQKWLSLASGTQFGRHPNTKNYNCPEFIDFKRDQESKKVLSKYK